MKKSRARFIPEAKDFAVVSRQLDKKLYFLLWLLCIAGVWSITPFVRFLEHIPSSTSMVKMLLWGTLRAAPFYALICYLVYKLLPKTDLRPFRDKNLLKEIIFPGIIFGVAVGLVLKISDATIFSGSLLASESQRPPILIGALASFYGGINEEVLLRLFLFTLIYFIFKKIFRFSDRNRLSFLWVTNVIVAVTFGLSHLPAAFTLVPPSSFEICRVVLLNGIAGVVFGWLYWSKGLWTAMTAHFMADLALYVFLR